MLNYILYTLYSKIDIRMDIMYETLGVSIMRLLLHNQGMKDKNIYICDERILSIE